MILKWLRKWGFVAESKIILAIWPENLPVRRRRRCSIICTKTRSSSWTNRTRPFRSSVRCIKATVRAKGIWSNTVFVCRVPWTIARWILKNLINASDRRFTFPPRPEIMNSKKPAAKSSNKSFVRRVCLIQMLKCVRSKGRLTIYWKNAASAPNATSEFW